MKLDPARAPESDVLQVFAAGGIAGRTDLSLASFATLQHQAQVPTLRLDNGSDIAGARAIAEYLMETGKAAAPLATAALEWISWSERTLRPLLFKLDGNLTETVGILTLSVVQRERQAAERAAAVISLESACSKIMAQMESLSKHQLSAAFVAVSVSCACEFVADPAENTAAALAWANDLLASKNFSAVASAKATLSTFRSIAGARKPLEKSLQLTLREIFTRALHKAFPPLVESIELAPVSASTRKGAGQYQCNVAMTASKMLKPMSPVEVATKVVANLEKGEIIEKAEVNGPGFINIFLNASWVAKNVSDCVFAAPRLSPKEKLRVAVDFSSPNIAKEMHVGHLRSTIIGETVCRMLEHAGHTVLRINHVGDWGTQFGMLLTHMRDVYPDFVENPPSISDLNKFYKESKVRFDKDEDFNHRSHEEVVKLQGGDASALAGWKAFCEVSRAMFEQVYRRLDVTTVECGESFYNDRIPGTIVELDGMGHVEEAENGAKIAWVKPVLNYPLILQKGDGGYGYDSTDAAAIRYRTQELNARWLIYVTDMGQQGHFEGIFELARKAGWLGEAGNSVRVDHVGFGVVQGKDKKRFKTRSGETVRLVDLLDEAKDRVSKLLKERCAGGETHILDSEVEEVSSAIGYGAVKYADLRANRQKDYVFDYDAMLNLNGDTAVYLLYAHARFASIIKKSGKDPRQLLLSNPSLSASYGTPQENALQAKLLSFNDVLLEIMGDLMPHHLCGYLYDLSSCISQFNSHCRVLGSAEEDARLVLCAATAVVMRTSLNLLGIQPLMRL
eukprot:g909.t1